jgi:hypothetical protein
MVYSSRSSSSAVLCDSKVNPEIPFRCGNRGQRAQPPIPHPHTSSGVVWSGVTNCHLVVTVATSPSRADCLSAWLGGVKDAARGAREERGRPHARDATATLPRHFDSKRGGLLLFWEDGGLEINQIRFCKLVCARQQDHSAIILALQK